MNTKFFMWIDLSDADTDDLIDAINGDNHNEIYASTTSEKLLEIVDDNADLPYDGTVFELDITNSGEVEVKYIYKPNSDC